MVLYGREAELDLIEALVRGDATDEPLLMLSGEPGVGKTALLDAAADLGVANGVVVLRATALEYEAELAFGALSQLLYSLLDDLTGLDEPHRRALAVICGLETGPAPSQLIAGAATVALVRKAAERAPLLFLIDDAPWLDLPSAMALTYLARRLGQSSVRLIVAARTELENVFVRSGFHAHLLRPLDDRSSDELLVSTFPALSPNVRLRLRQEAWGNPLALLELPTALGHPEGEPLPPVLPLTDRLQHVFADRLQSLPEGTREMLLLVVLAGAENSVTLEDCLPPPEGRLDLAPAEHAGVVRLNLRTGRMEFRHPLLRSAVFEFSTSDERRRAHSLLAEAFAVHPGRRAWHLGQAATAPDENVAASLETVAQQLLHSGDSARATSAMLRAAELSPAQADRSRRIARSAYFGSLVSGQLGEAPRMLVEAADQGGSPPSLAAATAAAYQILNGEGDAATAQRLLIAALREQSGDLTADDDSAMEALHTLVYVGFYAGRQEFWEQTERELGRVRPQLPDTLDMLSGPFADPARADQQEITRLTDALDGLRFTSDPLRISRIATSGAYLDRVGPARDALWRVIEDGRRGGAITNAIEALFLIGLDDYFTGEWDELGAVTAEGLRCCADLGYALSAAPGRFLQALVAAARGDQAAADHAAEELLTWAAPRRLYTVAAYASHARCMIALGQTRFDDAYRHAASVCVAGSITPFTPHALWLILDLVEAASRSGKTTEAEAHARAARDAGVGRLSSRLQMVTTAALALVEHDGWQKRFDEALSTPGTERWVFDRARVRLLYGERLRRARENTEARAHLLQAIDEFELLRAEPWAERARAELRATGTPTRANRSPLTPQELAIANLASTGMTNKEIGERLFLSARTVSTHLYRVFPKLGISTRSALHDAMRQQPDTDGADIGADDADVRADKIRH